MQVITIPSPHLSGYYPRVKHFDSVRNYYDTLQQCTNELLRIEPHQQTNELNIRIIEELQSIRLELQTLNTRMARLDEQFLDSETQDMPVKKAREMIEPYLKDYFEKHEEIYPSDVANALGLKYETVCAVFLLLEKEKNSNEVKAISKPPLIYHSNPNDAVKGKRVIIEAQRFDKPYRISGRTSRHGGNRVKADNAEAWVEKAYSAGEEL